MVIGVKLSPKAEIQNCYITKPQHSSFFDMGRYTLGYQKNNVDTNPGEKLSTTKILF